MQQRSDTAPEALETWLERLRKMSAGEKIATVFELTRFARDMAATGVRLRHPNASNREVFLRVAALHLTREEMIRAYQWDPREHDDPSPASSGRVRAYAATADSRAL